MQDKKIVACCGSFDGVIHPGHLFFLQRVKEFGDIVVVLVGADQTIRNNKKREPIFLQQERMEHVKATLIPDIVIPLEDDFSQNLTITLQTNLHIFCFGHDQKGKWVEDLKAIFKKQGISVYTIPPFRRDLYATSKQLV